MNPRRHVKGLGWPVYARDRENEGKCRSCGATVYWVEIVTKRGEIKKHPLSAATAKKKGEHTFMDSHFSDCPAARQHGGRR